MIVAIQPDCAQDDRDRSSPRWAELLQNAGHEVRWVDVFRHEILDQLRGCDGFMWRHGHNAHHRAVAKRLLPVIENELGLCVYPDQNTCWHYDDKIAQYYLFQSLSIPMPRTWVFWRKEDALEFSQNSSHYPLVVKLWAGATSANVGLVRNAAEAREFVDMMFSSGVFGLRNKGTALLRMVKRRVLAAAELLITGRSPNPGSTYELHKNYVLFQEFVPNNSFDTRILIVGRRAFGFRRFNRDGDFRASGSGKLDQDPNHVSLECVRLAFLVARKLRTQSCAMDMLWRGTEPVVCEISYTCPGGTSGGIATCPGHWELLDGELVWCEGAMLAEEALIQDFLTRLSAMQSETKAVSREGFCNHLSRADSQVAGPIGTQGHGLRDD